MESFRMRKIFNATGTEDYIDADFLESYVFECCKFSGIPLVDIVCDESGMIRLSVIVFEDTWSRNIYALKYYETFINCYSYTNVVL